jgi:hypothetical protein
MMGSEMRDGSAAIWSRPVFVALLSLVPAGACGGGGGSGGDEGGAEDASAEDALREDSVDADGPAREDESAADGDADSDADLSPEADAEAETGAEAAADDGPDEDPGAPDVEAEAEEPDAGAPDVPDVPDVLPDAAEVPEVSDAPDAPDAPDEELLHVEGNLLRDGAGRRVVVVGSNIYLIPFYGWPDEHTPDRSLVTATDRAFAERERVFARMRELYVNFIRVPLGYRVYESELYASRAAILERIVAIADSAEAAGLHVMFEWHDFSGSTARFSSDYAQAFPMITDVREALGDRAGVIYNPFNEPSNDRRAWAEWQTPTRATIRFFREDLGYAGVLVIDTTGWSWAFDPDEVASLLDFDATLAGGSPNLLISTHRYPKNDGSVTSFDGAEREEYVEETLRHVGTFPIVAGEHGWYLAAPPQPLWLEQLLDYLVATSVPEGHNGVFAWVWNWSFNALVDADLETLTEHGTIFREHYWQHFPP